MLELEEIDEERELDQPEKDTRDMGLPSFAGQSSDKYNKKKGKKTHAQVNEKQIVTGEKNQRCNNK